MRSFKAALALGLPLLWAAHPAAAATRVRLNPGALVLPSAAPTASVAERQFVATADAQVRATYLQDAANTAQLAGLQARLEGEPALAPLGSTWRPILASAHSRALVLEALAPALGALAEAGVGARPAAGDGLVGLDIDACGRAFDNTALSTPAAASFVVRAGRLGHRPLASWQQLCRQARWAKLQQRQLAGQRVGPRLEAWAQRQPRLAQLVGGRLVRLHRVGGKNSDSFVAGIVRQVAAGGEPCAMVRLSGRAFAASRWRRLGRPVPLLCQRMLVPARFQ